MSDNPQPAHDLASAAHPDAAARDQFIVIARYSIVRTILLHGFCMLFSACGLWFALHPETWPKYHLKTQFWIVSEQILGVGTSGFVLLALTVGYGVWLARGAHTMITLKKGVLRFPMGRRTALEDVMDVSQAVEEGRYKLNVIRLSLRDGDKVGILQSMLKDKPDIVIARLNDALARHRVTAPAPDPQD